MIVYLDNASTTKPYREAAAEMMRYMTEEFGNPSSLHRMGLAAENAMREARKNVAALVGGKEEEVFFTSGGTEADNMALLGAACARKKRGNKIITSAVEHPAVLESCKRLSDSGFEVTYVGVDGKGRLKEEELIEAIDDKTILISIMQVNNEVGTILPIQKIAAIKGDRLFHTDAVQGFGKLQPGTPAADLVTVSGHKIHGPKGSGALYIRKGVGIAPLLFGGGQEKNMRSGTENVPAVAGFGKAAEIALRCFNDRMKKISASRAYFLAGIKSEIRDVRINSPEETSAKGDGGYCSPAILNVSFLGTRGEVILHGLERHGIYVSTGSACASNKKGKSHVLTAMGLSEKEIECALRFSFSEENTVAQMDYALDKLKDEVNKFRKLGSFR